MSSVSGPQLASADLGAAKSAVTLKRPFADIFAITGAAFSPALTLKRWLALVCVLLGERLPWPLKRSAAELNDAAAKSSVQIQTLSMVNSN